MSEKIEYRGFRIEFRAMLSNEPSYFSKKRFTSMSIFIAVLLSYLTFVIINIRTMTALEFVEISGAMMVYGGFNVWQTQKEKQNEKQNNSNSN